MLNTVFFGSSEYCLPICNSLLKSSKLVAVVTKQDMPVGREKILTPSPIRLFAVTNGIPHFTPANKQELSGIKDSIEKFNADYIVVADYGMIIPKSYFDSPADRKVINIHFSKLPDLRGASPVQFTILRGDESSWITFQLMDEEMDTGAILQQTEVMLKGDETTGELYKKLFEIAADKLPEVLKDLKAGKIQPVKQDGKSATYTKLLTKEDGFVPWDVFHAAVSGDNINNDYTDWLLFKYIKSQFPVSRRIGGQAGFPASPARLAKARAKRAGRRFPVFIERMLRAFDPWPGVWTTIEINQSANKPINQLSNKRLKILKGRVEYMINCQCPDAVCDQPASGEQLQHRVPPQRESSTVVGRSRFRRESMVKKRLMTKDEELKTINRIRFVPEIVQLEGKNPVGWEQFLDGYSNLIQGLDPR